jgi:predicted ribosome quality control (RQC) complex YloA/Tae2 family protein
VQRIKERVKRALLNATKKADKVKKDQERRANDLRREEALQETRATLIEYNLEKVNAVIAAVNSLLASGQSWDDIERFVADEKRQGNPVAGLVKHLDLKNNAVTVALTNRLDDVLPDEDVSLLETSSDAANAFRAAT